MNADKPANGGNKSDGKPGSGRPGSNVSTVIRAIRDWFTGALHVLAHKVWPAVRSFATRTVDAVGRALRRGAAQLGPIVVRAAGAIVRAA